MKLIKGSGQTTLTSQPAFRNVGVLFALTGGVLLACACFLESAESGTRGMLAVSGVASLIGSFFLLAYRDHTVLDITDRTYTRRKGFVWSLELLQGSFDEFEGVEIIEMRTPGASGSSTSTSYIGQIVSREGRRPIQVVTSINLDTATREAEEAANALGIELLGLRSSSRSHERVAQQ